MQNLIDALKESEIFTLTWKSGHLVKIHNNSITSNGGLCIFSLKETDFLLYLNFYEDNTFVIIWKKLIININSGCEFTFVHKFEEVFASSPKNIQEKMVFYLDILSGRKI